MLKESSQVLKDGVFLLRMLFNRPPSPHWPLFNCAKEFFARDFNERQEKVEKLFRQIKDWTERKYSEAEIKMALAELAQRSKAVFSTEKKEIELDYSIMLNFLAHYNHLNEELDAMSDAMKEEQVSTLVSLTEVKNTEPASISSGFFSLALDKKAISNQLFQNKANSTR